MLGPATIPDGSVHYFGLVSQTPFSTVRLFNPLQADTLGGTITDGLAIDDITIGEGAVPPGDYNDDSITDAADYVVWRKFDGTSTDLPNDPNAVPIDNDQYDTWRTHFGESAGGTGANARTTVPEPTTLVLLLFAAAGWRLRRARAA